MFILAFGLPILAALVCGWVMYAADKKNKRMLFATALCTGWAFVSILVLYAEFR